MANQKVLVLGGNFAGLTAALSLKHELQDGVDVTVLSKSDQFQFNPSFIWIPFGRRKVNDVVFPVAKTFTSHDVRFVHGEATTIDPTAQQVQTTQGMLGFDYLVIATGYLNDFEGRCCVLATCGMLEAPLARIRSPRRVRPTRLPAAESQARRPPAHSGHGERSGRTHAPRRHPGATVLLECSHRTKPLLETTV